MRVSKRVLGLGCAIAVASGLALAGLPSSDAKADKATPSPSSVQSSARASTVTLITGDKVTIRGERNLVIEPGPGREDVTFHQRSDGKSHYVYPSDASDLVAKGTLDRQLFDVTALVEQGYDDAASDELPLILSYAGGSDGAAATTKTLAGADIRTTTELSSVDGAAVTVDKTGNQAGWSTLRSAVQDNKVERVWLDAKREVHLNESVPQVGAPEAWDAGFTGKGATVAVLDSGIDAEHPDLAGAVAASKDFSDSPSGTHDKNGHGTHVASTIVGSGKASDGKYVGVAPDADLLVGKVIGDDGQGKSSDILKGMEWAAETKQADVVNMSLGSLDQPGRDPLERAVGSLTEKTGTLFVISAGNFGPSIESIDSPASAPASLAVGAVTKQDTLADFSSRGPAPGDDQLKPDITAPGAAIVAAKAKGSNLGKPVGKHYVTASGTSMATPHVVGAAALLIQQHKDWSAPELKSALMASAKPDKNLTPYDQGTGRLNLPGAIEQTVVSEPASIQFGVQRWPHDDDKPVRKKLTYRNHGDQPVELDLTVELNHLKGDSAPEEMIQLSKETLTVPAGKTASTTVTADTRHDARDGRYAGQVVASAGDQQVRTPLAVEREVESYDLEVKTIDADGKPLSTEVFLDMVEGSQPYWTEQYIENGEETIRLPKGDYLFEVMVERSKKSYLLVQPTLRVDKNTTITADLREAKQISTTVQRDDADTLLVMAGFVRERFGNPNDAFQTAISGRGFTNLFLKQLGPDVQSDGMTGLVSSQWTKNGKARNSPYTYTLVDAVEGNLPADYERKVSDEELAALKTEYNSQHSFPKADFLMFAGPDAVILYLSTVFEYDLPTDATHYVDGGDISASQELDLYSDKSDYVGVYSAPLQNFPTGKTIDQRWNAAAFAPWPRRDEDIMAKRFGDRMQLSLPMYSDSAGHAGGWDYEKAGTTLVRDGKQVASSKDAGYLDAKVPSGDAKYELSTTASRSSTATFSTRTKTSWTFQSDTAGEKGTTLPIWGVRFEPEVNRQNVQHDSDGVSKLPVKFAAPSGFENDRIAEAKLEVSTDDGKTWKPADLTPNGRNAYLAEVRTDKDASFVSLRGTATDVNGNKTSFELIRAYGVSR